MELYKKYRPSNLDEFVGHERILNSIEQKLEAESFPHSSLFCGPHGTGKTSLARVCAAELECAMDEAHYIEMNSADFTGVEFAREIRVELYNKAYKGKCRVWVFDECHKMSSAAQNAMLKPLEDTPKHVYFMLCTTEPEKLLPTVRSRCTMYKLDPLKPEESRELIHRVLDEEKREIDNEVIDEIITSSEGSARKALVILETVLTQEDPREQMAMIGTASHLPKIYELFKLLMFNRNWNNDVSIILKKLENEEPEQIRHYILACAKGQLLNAKKEAVRAQASIIIEEFSDNFFDSKFAGLVNAVYQVLKGER